VLRAAKECGVRRVVLTSSSSAIAPNPRWPADAALTEESWADAEAFKKDNVRDYSLLAPYQYHIYTLISILSLSFHPSIP
jgi:nucleoside-diphosphate-sugar epimerase